MALGTTNGFDFQSMLNKIERSVSFYNVIICYLPLSLSAVAVVNMQNKKNRNPISFQFVLYALPLILYTIF